MAEYRQRSGFHQFPDGVDPYKVPGDPKSGLLWGISPDALQPNGTGDDLVQTLFGAECPIEKLILIIAELFKQTFLAPVTLTRKQVTMSVNRLSKIMRIMPKDFYTFTLPIPEFRNICRILSPNGDTPKTNIPTITTGRRNFTSGKRDDWLAVT